jgi:hypothetical protein
VTESYGTATDQRRAVAVSKGPLSLGLFVVRLHKIVAKNSKMDNVIVSEVLFRYQLRSWAIAYVTVYHSRQRAIGTRILNIRWISIRGGGEGSNVEPSYRINVSSLC